MRAIVDGERVLGTATVRSVPIRVTTSSAPRTVRVYVRDTLACTIAMIGGTPRPAWLALYQSRELRRWRSTIEKAALDALAHLDLTAIDAADFTAEAAS